MINSNEKNRLPLIIFIVGGMVLLVAILGYGYVNYKYGIGFPCMSNKIFGINCPGCGMTRAAIAMMRLDFGEAIKYNAFSIILLPMLFVISSRVDLRLISTTFLKSSKSSV